MKFQNCILISFVKDAQTDGQAQSNMPLQLFQSWGHKQSADNGILKACKELSLPDEQASGLQVSQDNSYKKT